MTETVVEQVGGSHYKSKYQHWHWVEDVGMGYLESQATKYLVRWRKKNGVEDLQKAHSYVLQLLVIHQEHGRVNKVRGPVDQTAKFTRRFLHENAVPNVESGLCDLLLTWACADTLYMVLAGINDLIGVETGPIDVDDLGHTSASEPGFNPASQF